MLSCLFRNAKKGAGAVRARGIFPGNAAWERVRRRQAWYAIFRHFSAALTFLLLFASRQKVEVSEKKYSPYESLSL